MTIGLDRYSLHARLKPALLTLAPLAWTLMAWSPDHVIGWSGLSALLVSTGGTFLLAQLARDRGKRKEAELFSSQGGRPSERFLCHAHAPNPVLLARRHTRLRALLPDLLIPTAEEEAKDPEKADAVYRACTSHLIALTRSDSLLLQENINFGFRRNLWGLKPLGIALSAACAIALGLQLYVQFSSHAPVQPFLLALEGLNAGMLGIWLLRVRPAWVMLPGCAYAERLLETLDRPAKAA